MMDKIDKIIDIIKLQIDNLEQEINLETRLKADLGYSSIDFVEMLCFLEKKFGVILTESDIETAVTVKDILNLIESKISCYSEGGLYPNYNITEFASVKKMISYRYYNSYNDIFCITNDNNIKITYGKLYKDVAHMGAFYYKKDIRHKKIAIVAKNSYEWIVIFLAAITSGNVAVPIDYTMPKIEIDKIIQNSECDILFTDIKNLEFKNQFYVNQVEEIIDSASKEKELIKEYEKVQNSKSETALIVYTSGTTGIKKGVELTNCNIIENTIMICKNCNFSGTTAGFLPFYHMYGLTLNILVTIASKCSIYITNPIKPFSENIQQVEPNFLCLVPLYLENIYRKVLKLEASGCSNEDKIAIINKMLGGKLEFIVCGGAPLSELIVEKLETAGIKVLNGYGITECAPVISLNRNYFQKKGSVGKIVEGVEVKILRDTSEKFGEIIVKGGNVSKGYYKNEEETKMFFQDGWFFTGDRGYVDEDSFLFITGRKKNLIILSNGENVSPEELELKFLKYTEVKEIRIFEEKGKILAEILIESDQNINNLAAEVVAKVNAKLSVSQKIVDYRLVDSLLERTSTGKIKRN